MTIAPDPERAFPDISDILARKEAGRRELAARSWSEKIRRMEALRAALAPFARSRPPPPDGRPTQD